MDIETVSTMGSGSLGRELDLEELVTEIKSSLARPVQVNFTSIVLYWNILSTSLSNFPV